MLDMPHHSGAATALLPSGEWFQEQGSIKSKVFRDHCKLCAAYKQIISHEQYILLTS